MRPFFSGSPLYASDARFRQKSQVWQRIVGLPFGYGEKGRASGVDARNAFAKMDVHSQQELLDVARAEFPVRPR